MEFDVEKMIAEVVSMTEKCPKEYSQACFKVLLEHELRLATIGLRARLEEDIHPDEATPSSIAAGIPSQREVLDSDLHLKFKQYMKKYNINLDKINNLFYVDKDEVLPLFDDLKTIRSSEIQIRITLLNSVINAIKTGSFEVDGEAVRAECQKRKAYDSANFTRNFKNSASLFEGFDNYTKGQVLKLSEEGKEESSKVLGELQ